MSATNHTPDLQAIDPVNECPPGAASSPWPCSTCW